MQLSQLFPTLGHDAAFTSRHPRVAVVGGGFGGMAAAKALAAEGCHIDIIDRHPYTTFQPLLYQVATGGLNPGDVTYRLRSFAAKLGSHARFRRASVTSIDTENRLVHCDNGEPIEYDYLVLAQGVGANFFGTPGAAEHSYTIYTRGSSLTARDVIFSNLEALDTDVSKTFDVIIVGGGPTGVETAGTLAEMKSVGIPAIFPDVSIDRVHVTLVEMGSHLLAPFDSSLRHYTRRQLQKRGVDVRTDTAIAEVREDSVLLKDGHELPADMVIWAAGVGAHKVAMDWGFETGRGGRIVTDSNLRVHGQDRIFAVGDGAIIDDNPLPQLAQPAIQGGQLIARQIVNLENNRPLETFQYVDKGTMATIGRNAAVVQLANGPKFTGFLAWLVWVTIHIYSLLGGRNRIQAMINLGSRYLTFNREAGAIVGDVLTADGNPGKGDSETFRKEIAEEMKGSDKDAPKA
ncbi:NAD(P)/FAD-dependent oxidoreductase [Acidipropionibacterium jensenii]|uniref:NAD(P)/FAD-dependent oxidoreductase n=1 Tax=Acidipropionibacterium jensenii TaxID=1749 RepID=UPI00110A175B|nr:NAD(P)/FAD-dependent oxidoreductase [Acidipropionibacterium jensenii]QCV87558.1 NAD(P)/FAD-dependent oxidoreductase [Acidipropionibacterium jensenii]